MKTIITKLFLALTFLFLFSACEELGIEADACDRTVLTPNLDVRITAEVKASDSGENIIPIKVRFYKTACGFDTPKPNSTFTYSGKIHRSKGQVFFFAGFVRYNIRNEKDIITIDLLTDRNQDGDFEIEQSFRADYINLDPEKTTTFKFNIKN